MSYWELLLFFGRVTCSLGYIPVALDTFYFVESSDMFVSIEAQPRRWVLSIASTFFFVSLILVLNRYFTFHATFDQGIFNQVFWNGTNGNFFQSSLSSQLSTNVVHGGELPKVFYHRLGQHFTPALLLWLPIYSIFPNAVTLAVLLVVIVTAGGLVLYPLACNHVKPSLAVMIVASYFCANAVIGPTWSNFHDVCQMPLFIFSLLLGLERRWWWLYFPMATLIPFIREDSAIATFSIGLYFVLSRIWMSRRDICQGQWQSIWRSREHLTDILLGVGLCFYSVIYLMWVTGQAMPLFSADVSKRFMLERFGQYATGDEASSVEIIFGMLRNPLLLITELISPVNRTVLYLLGHWLPLAFVPAISPASWLAASGPLFKLLVAKGFSVLSIKIRYAMAVVPGLFYGAVVWWGENPQKFDNPRFRQFWVRCLALSVFLSVLGNPNHTLSFIIPESVEPWVYSSPAAIWRHSGIIYNVLRDVPKDASVAATTQLVPHLSSRREILRFPQLTRLINDQQESIDVEYIAADIDRLVRYQSAFGTERDSLKLSLVQIDSYLENGTYGIVKLEDGVILMRRRFISTPESLLSWKSLRQSIRISDE